MNKLIDTHAHLTFNKLYPRLDEVINNAKTSGVSKILCICTNKIEFERALKIKNDMIDLAYGFTPQDANDIKEEDFTSLIDALENKQIVALGEIGLDYYWVKDNAEIQKQLFIKQMKLANKYNVPILIHMREATKDTLDLLRDYNYSGFVMHCFSGSKDTAKEIIRMGGYISICGPITFKNAKGLLEVPSVVPNDKIFVETDCPYMTPEPFRGKQNEPMYVKYTFKKVCELKKIDEDELSKQMLDNYQSLFYGITGTKDER